MVYDNLCGIHLSDWEALTPAQRNALAWRLMRQAHAARSRAIGKALLAIVGHLFGWTPRAHAAAAVPASARGPATTPAIVGWAGLRAMPAVRAEIRYAVLRAGRTIRSAWKNHLRRRRRQRDFAALVALDDMSLRDMGISRVEIRGAIRSRTDLSSVRR